jgi:hypothetical protein
MQHSATVPVLPTHDAQDAKASEESSDKGARKSMKRSTTIAATAPRNNLGPDALEFLAAIRAKLNESMEMFCAGGSRSLTKRAC